MRFNSFYQFPENYYSKLVGIARIYMIDDTILFMIYFSVSLIGNFHESNTNLTRKQKHLEEKI